MPRKRNPARRRSTSRRRSSSPTPHTPVPIPATLGGKEAALKALAERRAKYKNKESVNNSALPAGSSMYFDCPTCNGNIVVPESYTSRPELCTECEALKTAGWLE